MTMIMMTITIMTMIMTTMTIIMTIDHTGNHDTHDRKEHRMTLLIVTTSTLQ